MDSNSNRRVKDRRTSFTVPDGFFERLPAATLEKMARGEERAARGSTSFVMKRVAAVVVPLAACLTVGLFIFDRQSTMTPTHDKVRTGGSLDQLLKSLTDEELRDLAFQINIDPVDINL